MLNSRRSWPFRPTSIRPVASLSGRGIGNEIAQRSKKLTGLVLRRSNAFLRPNSSDFATSAILGATIGVVGSIKGPIARAVYWTNQNIIDGIVNAVGVGAKVLGRFTYDVIDQKGVDGVVNGIGVSASETGGVLRLVQSGRVQQYALMLFAAVGLLGLALILFT